MLPSFTNELLWFDIECSGFLAYTCNWCHCSNPDDIEVKRKRKSRLKKLRITFKKARQQVGQGSQLNLSKPTIKGEPPNSNTNVKEKHNEVDWIISNVHGLYMYTVAGTRCWGCLTLRWQEQFSHIMPAFLSCNGKGMCSVEDINLDNFIKSCT